MAQPSYWNRPKRGNPRKANADHYGLARARPEPGGLLSLLVGAAAFSIAIAARKRQNIAA